MKLARSSVPPSSVVIAGLLCCSVGESADARAALVLSGEASPAFERELVAEASEVGLVVVKDAREDPARALAEHGAVAVLRVSQSARVEVWYGDRRERLRIGEHEVLTATTDSTEPFAARVVEQVRAHLVKLSLLPSPEQPTSTPVTPVAAEPAESAPKTEGHAAAPSASRGGLRPRRLWVETGAGGTAATGGVPASLQGFVGLRAAPGHAEVEVFGLLPLTDGDVSGREGGAEVAATLIGAHADYALSEPESTLQGTLGAGGGALILALRGEATSPYSGHGESLATAVFFAHAGVRHRLSPWLALRASTLVGFSAPRPVVSFAGRDVAAWGRTFGTLVAAFEFGVPGFGGAAP